MEGLAADIRPRVAFVEEKHSDLLEEPLIIRGELSFDPPDTLQRIVFSPHEEKVSVKGNTLTAVRPGREPHTLDLSREPVAHALVEAFRGMLSGNLDRLKQYYQLQLSGTETDWQLKLIPLKEEVASVVETMQFEGSGTEIVKIAVHRTDGDITVTHLHRVDS